MIIVSLIIASIMIVVVSFIIFPKPFPTEEQIKKQMNDSFPDEKIATIQDVIFLDKKHVVVPFVSEQDTYGLSIWILRMNKWELAKFSTNGNPFVWRVDPHDLASYRILWNIHPNDEVESMKFYMIRDRSYLISDDEFYYPRIQMEETVFQNDVTYSVLPLPNEWTMVLNDLVDVETYHHGNLFFDSFFPMQHISFSWIAYDKEGNETYPERTIIGSGYSSGVIIDHMGLIGEAELE